MKFCANCGAMIEENVKFCPSCGSPVAQSAQPTEQPVNQQPVYQQPVYQQPVYQQPVVEDKYKGFPMKWYKFLVYFGLWLSAFFNGVSGITTLVTGIHQLTHYGTAISVYNVILGILIIGIAVLVIVTAVKLLQLSASGPKLLLFVYGVNLAVMIINIIVTLIIGQGFVTIGDLLSPSTITSIIVSIIMIAVNYTYFKKRESVFMN